MFKRISVLFFLLIFSAPTAFAQLPLHITASLGGGLLLPESSNLKGNFSDAHNYPLSKTSYTLGIQLRTNLSTMPISFTTRFSYNSLFDNYESDGLFGLDPIKIKYMYSLSIISAGVGVEYYLFPTPILKPYISGSLTLNFLSGNARYENDIIPESQLNTTNRAGMDLGLGALLDFPSLPISFDLQANYCFANLVGKQFNNSTNGVPLDVYVNGVRQNSKYNLNDAKDPNDANDHNRSINYITFTIGINFTFF
jgi:hypothetical protein